MHNTRLWLAYPLRCRLLNRVPINNTLSLSSTLPFPPSEHDCNSFYSNKQQPHSSAHMHFASGSLIGFIILLSSHIAYGGGGGRGGGGRERERERERERAKERARERAREREREREKERARERERSLYTLLVSAHLPVKMHWLCARTDC
jgi:hypothetical protein